jgi:hypothetical protein
MAIALHVDYNPDIHQTIEYDNINYILEKLDKMTDIPELAKDIWRYIGLLINMNKMYTYDSNKFSWLKKKDIPAKVLLTQLRRDAVSPPININITNDMQYYVYMLLLKFIALLDPMINGIDFMYSDKCKSKKIKEHPGYAKGKEYYYNAIGTVRHMLVDLYRTYLQKEKIDYYEFDIKNIKTSGKFKDGIEDIKKMLLRSYFISGSFKEHVDEIKEEDRSSRYTQMNLWIYSNIFTILKPCNYFTLMYMFNTYYNRIQETHYLYKLINKISNPGYLNLNINLS